MAISSGLPVEAYKYFVLFARLTTGSITTCTRSLLLTFLLLLFLFVGKMTSRLRSILGGSNRVKKRPSTSKPASRKGASPTPPSSSSWSASLPRTKSGLSSSSSTTKNHKTATINEEVAAQDEDFFNDDDDNYSSPLPDQGLVHALATDLTLRDVPQAMRYAREKMFTPLPDQPSRLGLSSTRVAEVLHFRRALPPLVTTAHLHALLRSPTAVERETAELVRAGAVRKVVVWRRALGTDRGRGGGAGGGVVEFLVEGGDLEGLVRDWGASEDELRGTGEAFVAWLRANPAKLKVSSSTGDVDEAGGDGRLKPEQADQLVRGGFLTTYHDFDIGNVSSGFARPEDRGTMLSLESVSRAAAGSIEAVGGQGAIHSSGGSGGARGGSSGGGGIATYPSRKPGTGSGAGAGGGADLSLALPGQGAYLKLLSAALSHLTSVLAKSTHREMPEGLLRERWDGGVASDGSRQHARKRERREFAGALAGRTRKWKQFHGLAFEWVLHEAVGAGLVEVFETGSVGRGVRLLV